MRQHTRITTFIRTAVFIRTIVTRTIVMVSIACVVTSTMRAQQAVGAFGSMSLNSSRANFDQLEGISNCNSVYVQGSAIAPAFGLFYDVPIASRFSLVLRGLYRQANTNLVSSENTAIAVSGLPAEARIDHTLEATLGVVAIQPLISYSLPAGFQFQLGTEVGYVMQQSFVQRETLEQPADVGAFENGRRTRNVQSGAIPNVSRIAISLMAGLSYLLPLNTDNTIQLVPAVSYGHSLTSVVKGLDWFTSSASASVGIRFVIPERDEPAPASPPAIEAPEIEPVVAFVTPSIRAMGVGADGTEAPIARVLVEEVGSTRVIPLLPYVFFESNSTALDDRYRNALLTDDALAVNRNILYEIGKRLLAQPEALLTIVGATVDGGNVQITDQLALERASAVAGYLQQSFGIDSNRVRVTIAPLLKANTPELDNSDGVAEVNRVELVASASSGILAPIRMFDTTRMSTPPTVRFYTEVVASEPIVEWTITTSQAGKVLKVFKGPGVPPESVDWVLAEDQASIPDVPGIVDVELRVASRTQVGTSATTLKIDQRTLYRKKVEYVADMEIEQFNILLFDIGSAELTEAQHQIIETDIKPRIRKHSKVTIVGHTDRMGDAAANAALSLARAVNSANLLGVPNASVRGVGESQLLFSNSSPEARCLCRTVEIRIETPVEAR